MRVRESERYRRDQKGHHRNSHSRGYWPDGSVINGCCSAAMGSVDMHVPLDKDSTSFKSWQPFTKHILKCTALEREGDEREKETKVGVQGDRPHGVPWKQRAKKETVPHLHTNIIMLFVFVKGQQQPLSYNNQRMLYGLHATVKHRRKTLTFPTICPTWLHTCHGSSGPVFLPRMGDEEAPFLNDIKTNGWREH
ncbi:hypothetical protein H6P81_011509 [Aristolochia fimbriata]|uniref:Uncharacterized protein n=1 Tax=Aristolochia fimbriata TaxID=158543 RepID=A0AAV7ESG1_ARIFI|nr:hypothetical protein H6P81_011509 [Aristolochia fimbriata]